MDEVIDFDGSLLSDKVLISRLMNIYHVSSIQKQTAKHSLCAPVGRLTSSDLLCDAHLDLSSTAHRFMILATNDPYIYSTLFYMFPIYLDSFTLCVLYQ